jgi:hypothetical protein
MTRVEWVASLDEDVRNKFMANIKQCNVEPGFMDYWMESSEKNGDRVHGIGGAFVWNRTKEGHEYWSRINANMLKA